MYNNINIDKVLEACETLAHRVTSIEGKYHGSPFLFDQCMRAFDNGHLPALAITFSVHINSPVNEDGEATIYRDGTLVMRTV